MTDNFGALDAFLDPGLKFTLRDKEYVIAPVDGRTGLWCERLAEVASGAHKAETDEEMAEVVAKIEALPRLEGDLTLSQRMLGPLHQQLLDDGVDHVSIRLLGGMAYVWTISSEDAARRFIQSGGRPESAAPNRAERRASRSTAGASKTQKPASSSGTRSRKATRPAASAKASRGGRS